MDLKIPPKKQGRQIGGDIGLTIKATGAPTKRTKIELCFRRFYLEPLILKNQLRVSGFCVPSPLTFTVPLSTLFMALSCVKEYGCMSKKKGEKGYGQQQEPEKSRAITLYKATAPLMPLPAAGIPICWKQGIPGFRKGRPKSL